MIEKLYLNAGQMKSGTTYLYGILKNHPQIYFSPEKEIHYLSQEYGKFKLLSDEVRHKKALSVLQIACKSENIRHFQSLLRWTANYLNSPSGDDWYENVFSGAKKGQYCADFSNLTCTISKNGLETLRHRYPKIKITYCVRDPALRAFSHMKFHLRFAGREEKLSDLSESEIKSLLLSDNIFPQSRSSVHIRNLAEAFGADNVRIIICERMWSEPQVTISRLCDFLDIRDFQVQDRFNKPVNVGPRESQTDSVMTIIRDNLKQEVQNIEACLREYSSLILN